MRKTNLSSLLQNAVGRLWVASKKCRSGSSHVREKEKSRSRSLQALFFFKKKKVLPFRDRCLKKSLFREVSWESPGASSDAEKKLGTAHNTLDPWLSRARRIRVAFREHRCCGAFIQDLVLSLRVLGVSVCTSVAIVERCVVSWPTFSRAACPPSSSPRPLHPKLSARSSSPRAALLPRVELVRPVPLGKSPLVTRPKCSRTETVSSSGLSVNVSSVAESCFLVTQVPLAHRHAFIGTLFIGADDTLPSALLFIIWKHMTFTGTQVSSVAAGSTS